MYAVLQIFVYLTTALLQRRSGAQDTQELPLLVACSFDGEAAPTWWILATDVRTPSIGEVGTFTLTWQWKRGKEVREGTLKQTSNRQVRHNAIFDSSTLGAHGIIPRAHAKYHWLQGDYWSSPVIQYTTCIYFQCFSTFNMFGCFMYQWYQFNK